MKRRLIQLIAPQVYVAIGKVRRMAKEVERLKAECGEVNAQCNEEVVEHFQVELEKIYLLHYKLPKYQNY